MALFRGIQEYIALDANNITLVFDSGNIVNISGNIFLYPPQGHPILYNSLPDYMTRTSFFECKGGHFEFTTNLPMSDIVMFIYDTFYQYYFINIQ